MRVGDQVILDAQRKFFDMLRRQKYQCRVCGSDQRAGGIFYDQWLD